MIKTLFVIRHSPFVRNNEQRKTNYEQLKQKIMKNLKNETTDLLQSGIFADRITDVPRSFIREILKVAINPDMISFAGGLPNRELFPVEELKQASISIFGKAGKEVLQYSNTEGFMPLRELIAERYLLKQGLRVSPENILITSGSQQGLDLLGKIFLNDGEEVILEEPGYLGAIQAFSLFRAKFCSVPLTINGIDTKLLAGVLENSKAKLMYTVPEFQNPSGISYTENTRKEVAELIAGRQLYLIEDNPYTELRFSGKPTSSFYKFLPKQTVLLGTFSKTVVPGFRLGWIVAPDHIMDKLIVAKQAADLHTNIFTQQLLFEYLTHYDNNAHIGRICEFYGRQRDAMVDAIRNYFPADVEYTIPEGGMFLWVTLPEGYSSMELFDIAIKQNVAFVPGNPFYTDGKPSYRTLRLNFSCSEEKTIYVGIKRLAEAIVKMKR
jgi:2-aminoadipate transaminase